MKRAWIELEIDRNDDEAAMEYAEPPTAPSTVIEADQIAERAPGSSSAAEEETEALFHHYLGLGENAEQGGKL